MGPYAVGNGTIFYKKVTFSQANLSLLQSVSGYILTGYGRMQAAIYSNNTSTNQPNALLQKSSIIQCLGPGWSTVAFTPVGITPGTYWLGVQVTGTGRLEYNGPGSGTDLFQYGPFGTWPNPANVQNFLGNADIYGTACGY